MRRSGERASPFDEPSHIPLCHAGSRPGIGARHRQHAKCQKPSPSDSFPKGTFLCRGAVSKETVRKMFEKYLFGNTETRILSECCLLSGSARHPNDEDLAKVETFARVMYQHLKDQ